MSAHKDTNDRAAASHAEAPTASAPASSEDPTVQLSADELEGVSGGTPNAPDPKNKNVIQSMRG